MVLAYSFVGWVIGWTLLFYVLSWTHPLWMRFIHESTKAHENDKYWCARMIIGIIHAIVVSLLCLPALVGLVGAPFSDQFAFSTNLDQCGADGSVQAFVNNDLYYRTVALAGLAFTAFTASDIIVSVVHRLATPDYLVHHAAFVTAGTIIRGNCMLPFNASILMAMEISTPFLNFLLLVRHRGERFQTSMTVSGIVFMVTYVLFRIVLNTYGAGLMWYCWFRGDPAMVPQYVPAWQVWFLLVAISAGAAVQFFWFPDIAKKFGTAFQQVFLSGGSKANSEGADGYKKLTSNKN